MSEFALNLNTYRKERGVTQQELATFCNTTVKTISHWATGYSEPSIEQLRKLATFFEITVDDLIGCDES